jgi:suppressor of fused
MAKPADSDVPGWDAISEALDSLYHGQEPKHYGTLVSWRLGGPDPLNGISAWKRITPVPHWHFVTYGFSDLFEKESDDPAVSGYGFELTFRLKTDAASNEPPGWALNMLQNLARYVFRSGNIFRDGEWMTANGPIALDEPTQLCGIGLVYDPELPAIETPNGRVEFIQIVGLTKEEEQAAKLWKPRKLLEAFLPRMPLWVTDLGRATMLNDPSIRQQVTEGIERDGSSCGLLYTDVLSVGEDKTAGPGSSIFQLTFGALQVEELRALIPARLRFQRELALAGQDWAAKFIPGDQNSVSLQENVLSIQMTGETIDEFVKTIKPREGLYQLQSFPGVVWKIERTVITDSKGNVTQIVG